MNRTGVGTGLGLGLLLAPRSGERTRLQIRRSASDSADYLRQHRGS
jgi:gas vesicle protein